MIKTFIIINENNSNIDFIENISKILPKRNTKIPIYIKLGNYEKNQIIYKSNNYIINSLDNDELIIKINNIINNLNDQIYFDKIIIELNSNKNIEYIILPSFQLDYNDDKLLSLYESYLELDSIIIFNINILKSNIYLDLIHNYNKENETIIIYSTNENINLTKYKMHFNNDIDKLKDYINNINNIKNKILNQLYLDLDNYECLIKSDYETFYNNIYISNKYRHYHFYKTNNFQITTNNYTDIKNNYNFELLDEYKNYEELINNIINIFDETFDYYFKKLEPEILKYFVTMYYNSKEYNEEFENDKDFEFKLMLKGLRKMCILIVKRKLLNN